MSTHVETFLHDWLKARFPAARLCTELPANLADAVPLLQVVGIGGTGEAYNFDSPRADIDAFGLTRTLARELALGVHEAVLNELPGVTINGTTALSASSFMYPTWAPYENTNVRRFVLSVGLRLHTRSPA